MKARSMSDDVRWYRANGKYPGERITSSGVTHEEYLIGDESWNGWYGRRPDKFEEVEKQMDAELGPWRQS